MSKKSPPKLWLVPKIKFVSHLLHNSTSYSINFCVWVLKGAINNDFKTEWI